MKTTFLFTSILLITALTCRAARESRYVVWDIAPIPGMASASTPALDSKMMDVDFPDEAIKTVLINLGDLYGVEIHVPSELGPQRVSFHLKNVSFLDVVRSMIDQDKYEITYTEHLVAISKKGIAENLIDHVCFAHNAPKINNPKQANQAPVPTATSVTPAANAPVAPAAAAAHLER